jgi:hypothetical protein
VRPDLWWKRVVWIAGRAARCAVRPVVFDFRRRDELG